MKKEKIIVDVKMAANQTLTVVYADGTCLNNIRCTSENIDRIRSIQAQQRQAITGELEDTHKKYKRACVGLYASGITACAAGSLIVGGIPYSVPGAVVATVGIGTITILGALPAYLHLNKTVSDYNELTAVTNQINQGHTVYEKKKTK